MIRLKTTVAVAVAVWAAMGPGRAGAAGPGGAPTPSVQVDGEAIDVQAALRPAELSIYRLETQIFELKRRAINEAIAKRLVEKEAARRGVSVQALLAEEVDRKVSPPTEAEVEARAAGRTTPGSSSEEATELRAGVRATLVEQRRIQRRNEFIASLRGKANVTIEGLEPPGSKTVIAPEGEPSQGPADAPVTIVEFSDFQCPFCARSQAMLKQLLRQYAGKVRLVYRDFPVAELHPGAPAAAEAARCAEEQGKFWPYHDVLYANPTKQTKGDLLRYAGEVGLDATKFRECVDQRRHAGKVARGVSDGRTMGVVATPTFFVNGVPIVGERPITDFTEIIERELRRQAAGGAPARR